MLLVNHMILIRITHAVVDDVAEYFCGGCRVEEHWDWKKNGLCTHSTVPLGSVWSEVFQSPDGSRTQISWLETINKISNCEVMIAVGL